MMNTFLIANITPTCKSLEDKSVLFSHFYLYQETKKKPGLHIQQTANKLVNKFFHRFTVAKKFSVLVTWGTAPVPLG